MQTFINIKEKEIIIEYNYESYMFIAKEGCYFKQDKQLMNFIKHPRILKMIEKSFVIIPKTLDLVSAIKLEFSNRVFYIPIMNSTYSKSSNSTGKIIIDQKKRYEFLGNKKLVQDIYQQMIDCSSNDTIDKNYDDESAYESMAWYCEQLPMVSQNLYAKYPHLDISFFSLVRDCTYCYSRTFSNMYIIKETFSKIIKDSNIKEFLILEKYLPQELFIAYIIDNASKICTIEMLDIIIQKYKDFIPNDVYIRLGGHFDLSIEYLERLKLMNKLCENTIACMIIQHKDYGPVARKNEILSKVLLYRAIYSNNKKAFEYLIENGVNITDFCKDKKLALYIKRILEQDNFIKNKHYDYRYPILDFIKDLNKKENERMKKHINKHYK